MKTITTIEQVFNQSEILNAVLNGTSQTTEVIIHDIINADDMEQLAKQENGHFFDFEGYKACSVTLGKVNYLLTNKNS